MRARPLKAARRPPSGFGPLTGRRRQWRQQRPSSPRAEAFPRQPFAVCPRPPFGSCRQTRPQRRGGSFLPPASAVSSGCRCSFSSAPAPGADIRITLSAVLSASCSNSSPGLLTVIFVCTVGATARRAGAKKPPSPARATKGCLAACVTFGEVVVEDFSALVLIMPTGEFRSLSEHPLHPQDPFIQGNRTAPMPKAADRRTSTEAGSTCSTCPRRAATPCRRAPGTFRAGRRAMRSRAPPSDR